MQLTLGRSLLAVLFVLALLVALVLVVFQTHMLSHLTQALQGHALKSAGGFSRRR